MASRLQRLIRTVGTPRSYFHGRTHADICIPNNILIFQRTRGTDLRRATFELRPHHRFVLIFNLKTIGTVRIDRTEVELHPEHGVLILPYQFHSFPKTQQEEILWLVITFECDCPAPLELFRGRTFQVDAAIRRRLASSLELYADRQLESVNQILALEIACILAQLQSLVTQSPAAHLQVDRRSHQLLNDVESYLRKSQLADVRIQDLARHLHISESRLRTQFRAAFGASLGGYLRNYRLHVAIDSMRDTRRNFTEIARDLGFSNSATFTRFIRSQTGFTPTEFRSRLIG